MNIDRDKEWKERRAFNLAELEARVAAIKAEIEEEAKPKKRLMTPAECAGRDGKAKWLVHENTRTRELVVGIDHDRIITVRSHDLVSHFHKNGWKIADTPTSEPYSLEIEE